MRRNGRSMTNLVGQTLQDYIIRELIGEGGYGAVYKAHQPKIERDVAIKIILPEHAAKPEFEQRFATEAKLVAQLEHPHIVPLYDYWQDDTGAYLVMRYIRGGSLRDLLKQQGALSFAQIIRILDQITSALEAAHESGIVHRDLKPDNILIDERGNAYLTDFGIAKSTKTDSQITGTDAIVGTWTYISPEQIEGKPVSPQTDIYALGFMLYEMVTGLHPFAGTAVTMMIMKHIQEPLPTVHNHRPDAPETIDHIIARATEKAPAERYSRAATVAESVHNAINLAPQHLPSLPTTIGLPPPSAVLKPRQSYTGEQRNRQAILQSVRSFWVDGVLENSLHGAVMIELGMKHDADQVDNPWDAVLRQPDTPDEKLASKTHILDIFDRLNGKLLILGDPGSGKTTTLLELARHLLYRAEADDEHPIPVVFNLSAWADERQPLSEWMVSELNTKYQVSRKVGEAWIEAEQILPMLDGLDEVKAEYRDSCVAAINNFRSEYGFVDIVVCSRIVDYEALTNRLRVNGAVVLQPLTPQQVDSYLLSAGDELDAVRTVMEADEKLRRLMTTPLMLSIVTLAYRGLDIDEIAHFDTLGGRRQHLFDTYVQRMLERRGLDKRYPIDDTRRWLSWLGENMSQRAQSVFYIEYLTAASGLQSMSVENLAWYQPRMWWLRALNVLIFLSFVSFMSLLGCFSLVLLPESIIEIVGNVLMGIFIFGGFVFLPMWLLASGFLILGRQNMLTRSAFPTVTKITWSWQDLRHRLKRWFVGGLLTGTILGISVFTRLSSVRQVQSAFISAPSFFLNLLGIAVIAVILGTLMALVSIPLGGWRLHREPPELKTQMPNEMYRKMARNNSLGIVVAVVLGAVMGTLIDNAGGLGGALFYMLVFGLFASSGALFNLVPHMLTRYVLYRRGKVPLNMADFLDYVSDRILMRKVGGGYIFIHRMLLEYFAGLNQENEKRADEDTAIYRLADRDSDAVTDEFLDSDTDNTQQRR